MLDLPLDKVIKACLYNSYKNVIILILLAKTIIKIDEDYYIKTKNIVSIDTTSIKELLSSNIINGDSLSDYLSTRFL